MLASTSHVPLCVGFLGGKFCHCWLTTKVGHANCPLFVRDQSGTFKCPTSVAHFGPVAGEEEAGEGGHSTTVGMGGWYGMVWHGMVCCIGNDSCFRRPCVVRLSSGYRSGTTQRSGTTSHSSFISSHDHDGAMMRSCARRTALLSYALHARRLQGRPRPHWPAPRRASTLTPRAGRIASSQRHNHRHDVRG